MYAIVLLAFSNSGFLQLQFITRKPIDKINIHINHTTYCHLRKSMRVAMPFCSEYCDFV